ncbi:MAG: histidine kinase dimerization/phospho-acceptor domain-containing protein [Lentimicrobiaceae bacterium]|nr:histidine kinase dimerization/phospho-acceptor domain-containing protein [Lentimicrobiaceae bacterium]
MLLQSTYFLTVEGNLPIGHSIPDGLENTDTLKYGSLVQHYRHEFGHLVIPLAYILGTGCAAMLFYRNKLRTPLVTLNMASEKIADDDLNFSVEYGSKDEMGRLCTSFEKMRGALEKNSREMWRSMEERKRLNAAFSHDLRTPLTVLRGYTDFLAKHLADDKLPKEKVLSTIHTMGNQIGWLESLSNAVRYAENRVDIAVSAEGRT